jgi:thioredoxin 1
MHEILTQKDFKNAIEKGVTLVDFNTPWCASCRAQDPILIRLAERFAGKAVVVKMNVDENRETALSFGIQSILTLVFFKNGRELQRFVGLQSEKILADTLKRILD